MIKYKQVQKMAEEPEAVVCDVCKDEFAADDLETQKFHHVRWLHLNTVTCQKKRVG